MDNLWNKYSYEKLQNLLFLVKSLYILIYIIQDINIYILQNIKNIIQIDFEVRIYILSVIKLLKYIFMNIRNFCIIAHIDHGKSTLADRMLELTGTIKKVGHDQMLDKLELEQERWITIKLTPARMQRKWYELNLIDTPWHVDFQYEVSRSLAACQWAILLVDASQWIQAQTLSVLYMAMDYGLEIIPVLNKIDLPAANPERVAEEIHKITWLDPSKILKVSGKTGQNVDKVLDIIISQIPEPTQSEYIYDLKNDKDKKDNLTWEVTKLTLSRGLIFDCVYDQYKWVVAYIQMINWHFAAGQTVSPAYWDTKITITEVGHFNPNYVVDKKLTQGQIWYIVTGQKSVRDVKIGDTMIFGLPNFLPKDELKKIAIPGFRKVKPFVYAGIYPISNNEFESLRDGFEKLSLNDSAIEYEYENNKALGYGFRCGFLGMLHMDIVKERLSREFGIETIFTTPNVVYIAKLKSLSHEKIKSWQNVPELLSSWLYKYIYDYETELLDIQINNNLTDEDMTNLMNVAEKKEIYTQIETVLSKRVIIRSGYDMPANGMVDMILEPIADVEVVGPSDYYGNISELCQEYRWVLKSSEYLDDTRVLRKYVMPLGEIIIDFYDRLKSSTKWYATMNYEFRWYNDDDLVKLDIMINGEIMESFSMICHSSKAYATGADITLRLKELIPKHLFSIPLQAAVGSRIIARENIPAIRKDVIAKCYGWDVSRKRKLLENQKEWKKRMKEIWNVSIPSDIFIKMVTR